MLKLAVLASGSGSNLQAMIDAIAAGALPAKIQLALSDKPDAFALERAKQAGIPTVVISPQTFATREEYDRQVVAAIQQYEVDVVALAGYMRIVTPEFLQAFPQRVVNIHPALLPAFPGLHGQRQAWEYGVKVSGCTVHFVDEGTDTGPIIAQATVPVLDTDDADTLAARILEQEHRLYPYVLKLLAEGRVSIEGRKVKIKTDVDESME